jgi:hypothetical protein
MAKSPPPTARAAAYDPVEAGYLDARGKLIEVAAFLDRVERRERADDYRVQALKAALGKLAAPDEAADRAGSVLRALSDPTNKPAERAGAPAAGAWKKEGMKSGKKRKTKS